VSKEDAWEKRDHENVLPQGEKKAGEKNCYNYYPFGLTFNSYQKENSSINKFKFQGQEHVDDLELNWDSFKWRNHQPDIGRFFNIDPLAEKYVYNSPYAFSENHVIAHREFEGLEKVSIQQTLGNNYNFYRAYNLQRQTTGGQGVSKVISGQNNVNVFYYAFSNHQNEAQTFMISDIKELQIMKLDDVSLKSLSDKELEQAMADKKLLLVGVNTDILNAEDQGENGASALNHEELSHGKGFVSNRRQSTAQEHKNYYGGNWFSYYSPSNADVKNNPRFSNGTARQQLMQIGQMIRNELDRQRRVEERRERREKRKE